jgi:drug/metabolite transporter (DMT)-like permease
VSEEAGFRDPKVLLPFILITLIWSSTWIVIKDQLGPDPATAVPPPWSVSYRFAIASAAMFVLATATGANLRIGRNGHMLAVLLGILQFCLNFNLVYFAEQYVTSGIVAVVFALLMVPNAALAWLFFRQPISARFVAGSLVALCGIGLLFVQEVRASTADPVATLTGIGFTLLGVLSASSANVLQLAPGVRGRPIAAMLAWGMLYAATLTGAFAWIGWGPPTADPRLGYWVGLAYLGIVASAVTFFFYFGIVRAVGPAKAAYSSVLIPIIAMAISTVAEGYRWTTLAVLGALLTLTGLVIALRTARTTVPAAPPGD